VELYNLGKIPWQETQLIYHALAELNREALCLVSPATPYVCIGFHQDAEQEVDLAYCAENNIPVFRREVGGGAVYLDGDQLFFQLILHRDNPAVPKSKPAFYKKFLQPMIDVYRRVGIPADYKPVNDLLAGRRKISGTGVGEIGDCLVFVGNLIVDFDYEIMARILKVPDAKFRDKLYSAIKDNLTTIRRELGDEKAAEWNEPALNNLMAEEFAKLLGRMQPNEKDDRLKCKTEELGRRMLTAEWLHQKGRQATGRDIKVRAGVQVRHKLHKAPGGLMRADFELSENCFRNVQLSGDFFCYPEKAVAMLEQRLESRPVAHTRALLTDLYTENKLDTPGIEIEDWMQVLGS
jgi:lipoate-protein ligase A